MFITITRSNDYLGVNSYKIGQELYLVKEHDSCYDDESIKVVTENNIKYGYVANSVCSVARGTHSAGYIYNTFDETAIAIVRFIIDDYVIAEIKQ